MKKENTNQIEWLSIVAIFVPLILVTGFSVYSLNQNSDENLIKYISILVAVILGLSLSSLIKSFDVSRRLSRFVTTETEFLETVGSKLDRAIESSKVLTELTNDDDIEALEKFARWLSANRLLSEEVSEISSLCGWQKSQVMNLLSTKARDNRDKEILIDDPVKELNSNTTLLLEVPNTEVVAVSFEDTPFWLNAEGQRFLQSHKTVLDRGVSITRVFITEGSDAESLDQVMKQQAKLGIKVYSVDISIVEALNPEDVVIYDRKLVRKGFNKSDTKNNMFKQARILATAEVVADELERTRAIIALATKCEAK